MSVRRRCSIDGCNDRVVGRRLCRKHYQRAWKAGELGQHTKLPTRKRDRKVCPPEHKHADASTCYIQHQCRCDACTDHHAAMEQRRSRLKAYGRFDTGLVDAEPVREHMMMLAEFGIGYKRAALLAGVGTTVARNVLWGRQEPGPRYGELPKRIKRENAEKLLAVRPDLENLAGGVHIPARGTHRRVQALVAMGWSQSRICERIGMERGNFWGMMQRATVTVSTHRAIAAVFDEWWNVAPTGSTPGELRGITMARRYAKQRRWLPPMAWDDIDNDVEPPVVGDEGGVDEIAVQLAMAGDQVRLSPAERREAVVLLHGSRLSDGSIAARLHVAQRTVQRIREELKLPAAVDAAGEPIVA